MKILALVTALISFPALAQNREMKCEMRSSFAWREGDKVIAEQAQHRELTFMERDSHNVMKYAEQKLQLSLTLEKYTIRNSLSGMTSEQTKQALEKMFAFLGNGKITSKEASSSLRLESPYTARPLYFFVNKYGDWDKAQPAGYGVNLSRYLSDDNGPYSSLEGASSPEVSSGNFKTDTLYTFDFLSKCDGCTDGYTSESIRSARMTTDLVKRSNSGSLEENAVSLALVNEVSFKCEAANLLSIDGSERGSPVKDVGSLSAQEPDKDATPK